MNADLSVHGRKTEEERVWDESNLLESMEQWADGASRRKTEKWRIILWCQRSSFFPLGKKYFVCFTLDIKMCCCFHHYYRSLPLIIHQTHRSNKKGCHISKLQTSQFPFLCFAVVPNIILYKFLRSPFKLHSSRFPSYHKSLFIWFILEPIFVRN